MGIYIFYNKKIEIFNITDCGDEKYLLESST